MPLEDILYQAYLLILSWPVDQEITGDGNSTAEADTNNATEHDML